MATLIILSLSAMIMTGSYVSIVAQVLLWIIVGIQHLALMNDDLIDELIRQSMIENGFKEPREIILKELPLILAIGFLITILIKSELFALVFLIVTLPVIVMIRFKH